MQCCKHTFFLTDRDQAAQIPPAVDTYFLKWRYYFQEYKADVTEAEVERVQGCRSAKEAPTTNNEGEVIRKGVAE